MTLFRHVQGIDPREVGARLKELLHERGQSQRALAAASGLPLSIVSAIATGGFGPGTAIGSFDKLAGALGVPLGELLGGEPADTALLVPLYGHAAAGLGAFNEPVPQSAAVEQLAVPRSLRPHDGVLSATTVRGDSMEPELAAGDIVVLHYPQRQPALGLMEDGALVAVTTADGGEWSDFIKRYRYADGRDELCSTNPAYAPVRLRLRDVQFVGRVRMVLKG